MIALFTDFGLAGPYTGQVKAVLARQAPGVPVVDLFADLPAGDPQSAAYLLAAYAGWFAPPIVLLAVVDPGVGSMRRGIVAAGVRRRWQLLFGHRSGSGTGNRVSDQFDGGQLGLPRRNLRIVSRKK